MVQLPWRDSLWARACGVRPACPWGLIVRARATEIEQAPLRDRASEHGAPQACPAGLSFLARAAGVDQPPQWD